MEQSEKWRWFASAKVGNVNYIKQNINFTRKFNGIKDIELQNTALMYGTISNNVSMVEALLPYEKCLQNKYGWTALHMAAYMGALDCVKLLATYEQGILTTASFKQIPSRSSALQIAMQRGYIDCAIELIDEVSIAHISDEHLATIHGGNKYPLKVEEDSLMRTPMHYLACLNFNISHDVFAAYYQLYAGHHDVNGMTALMLAAQQNNYIFIEQAIKQNTQELRHFSNAGFTALMTATFSRAQQAASILANYEAGLQNSAGLTAMMLAAKYGQIEIINILLNKEKRMQTKERILNLEKGSCALSFAKYYGFQKIYSLLYKYEHDIINDSGRKSQDIQTNEQQAAMQDLISKQVSDSFKVQMSRQSKYPSQSKKDSSSVTSSLKSSHSSQYQQGSQRMSQQSPDINYLSPQLNSTNNNNGYNDENIGAKSHLYKIKSRTSASWQSPNRNSEDSKPNMSQIIYTEIIARPDIGVETEVSDFQNESLQQSYIIQDSPSMKYVEQNADQQGEQDFDMSSSRRKLVKKYKRREIKLQYDGDNQKIRKCIDSINLNGSSANIQDQLNEMFGYLSEIVRETSTNNSLQTTKSQCNDQIIQTDEIQEKHIDNNVEQQKLQESIISNADMEVNNQQNSKQILSPRKQQIKEDITNLSNQLTNSDIEIKKCLQEQSQFINEVTNYLSSIAGDEEQVSQSNALKSSSSRTKTGILSPSTQLSNTMNLYNQQIQ